MVTNFFKISFQFDEFDVQRTPYAEEKLAQLRASHNVDASFFRNGDFIYISPKKGVDLTLGETTRLAINQNPDVVESLVRHLVFRTFRDAFPDRTPEEFAPLRFPSTRPEHDPLRRLLPNQFQGVLGFPRVNEVHVRRIAQNGLPLIGLLVTCHHRWRFPVSLEALKAEGFDLQGCTVLQTVPVPGLTGVLAPDETVVGEIESIQDGCASMRTNDGPLKLPLAELHLQRTRGQIGKYLEFKLGPDRTRKIFEALRHAEEADVKQGKKYTEVLRVANWFCKQTFENADGFAFAVALDCNFPDSAIRLEPTRLVFDFGPGASASKPLTGLKNHGPFDSGKFDRKQPRVLAIFHERNRGAATKFLAQLIDGIPESQYFKKGFRELFRLHEVQYVLHEIQASFPEDYEDAIDQSIKAAGESGFDLALVECPEGSTVLPIPNNPYYRAKAKLMSYGIPVQCVREEHLRQSPSELSWTLGPAALQIYAKLGGIPWLLPGSQSVDAELIVGVGSSVRRPNLWSGAEQSRIVGMTTFFLGDGRYIMGQELRSVPYSEYFDELLKSLEESLNFVSKEYGWKDGKSVRLVFHVFKPLKNLEVDVVQSLVARFPQYKILFAFVTISTIHPWMMFSHADFQENRCNLTLCDRGANLILDRHSCLLQTRGNADRPNKTHRPPFPVLVRVHEKSTYLDLPFIIQQVLDFSFLNWRSFFPAELPVTIFFSNLMAGLSSTLQRTPGWNPTLLDRHFRRKPWFL